MGPWEALHCHLFDDSQGSRGLKLKARERSLWQSPPFFSFVKLPKPSALSTAQNGITDGVGEGRKGSPPTPRNTSMAFRGPHAVPSSGTIKDAA
jgi:hypothetical protein